MTGFGRSERQNGDCTCKVEVRSVNNRYIEVNVRLPRSLSALDLPLKKLIKSRCSRGSFEVTVSLAKSDENPTDLEIKPNLALAAQYVEAFKQIQQELGLSGEIEINSVLNLRDIIKAEPMDVDASYEEVVLSTVDEAMAELVKMRCDEGNNLQTDLLERIDLIEKHAESIKPRLPQSIREYQKRLKEKIQSLTEGVPDVDEVRLAQETAIMADRCDVTEEIIRLESHLQQFRSLTESDEPTGRKLEFLTQEINRETNTIGSKTIDHEVSRIVIEIKSTLEKIREQLQNIE